MGVKQEQPSPAERLKFDTIVVHYHEVALKRGNRATFEMQLRKNILRATGRFGVKEVDRRRGRILVYLAENADFARITSALQKVFGIAYFAPAERAEQEIDAMTEAALRLVANRHFESFRVETRRAQKDFPLDSVQVNRHIGRAIQDQTAARVDLNHPELTVHIEIYDNRAMVYSDRIPGAGGLPVGTGGKAVCLMSSGIDSPVAAYRIMKRGVQVIFVHFHSTPYTSEAAKENVRRLVHILTEYQYSSKLYFVPFLEIQQHITMRVPVAYRVIMYRRAMLSLAESIARRNRALALITGDSVAQVASQTLANLRAINAVASLPVLRPLAGDDKQEIINLAQKIGTYETSIQPYEDCCSLFVPGHPETHARMPLVQEYDAAIDHEQIYRAALQGTEETRITMEQERGQEQ